MAENSNTTLLTFLLIKLHDDGQPFSEKARLSSSYTYDFMCMFSLWKSNWVNLNPTTARPLATAMQAKVTKRHADACTPADLYQRVGGSSEPPEPPQRTGLIMTITSWKSQYITAWQVAIYRLGSCNIYVLTVTRTRLRTDKHVTINDESSHSFCLEIDGNVMLRVRSIEK